MAKPYNHRRAKNDYKKWKEKDERFMEKNGMPMDKILLMRDFDRIQFNSDRRFFEKVYRLHNGNSVIFDCCIFSV